MSYVAGIVIMVVFIIISVALHEVGHLLPAKRFGVYVPQYMVGFGPTLWSRKRGETEYGVKWILLGGYVRLAGMFRPAPAGVRTRRADGRPTLAQEAREASAAELPPGFEARAFYRLKVRQKLIVMFGGPLMNLLMAVVIMAVVIMGIGANQPTNTVAAVPACVSTDGTCPADAPAGPAFSAGIKPGDKIVKWNGESVSTWAEVVAAIRAGGSARVPVVVERDGVSVELEVTADTSMAEPKVGIISQQVRQRGSVADVLESTWLTLKATAGIVVQLPQKLWQTGQSLLGQAPREADGVVSIVGVGRLAGEVTSEELQIGWLDRVALLLSLWASLNVALFVFNLIPLPPLDGGHIVGALWEGARGSFNRVLGRSDPGAADTARLMPLTYAVVALLFGMTVLLVAADIVKPIGLF